MEVCKAAFASCTELVTVTFSERSTLQRIGANAFQNTGLKSFTAPASLREIGQMGFGNCGELAAVRLNKNLMNVGDLCFWGTKVEIP